MFNPPTCKEFSHRHAGELMIAFEITFMLLFTAKRMLERRGIQTLSSFVIFDWSYIPEFKASFLLFWLDFHLLKSIGSPLDHYLMAK